MSTQTVEHEGRIDYIEFPATDAYAAKSFYTEVFGWKFEDYGPDYTSFVDGRIAGGFHRSDEAVKPRVVIYSAKLEEVLANVQAAGATIVKEIFEFPGGRRFHFMDPAGNELAVWSDN